MSAPILEARDLRIMRGEKTLLAAGNLSLRPGRITVILGPNGVGKSSLLLALAGLLSPVGGEIRILGKPIHDYARRELAGLIAWQGQAPAADFGLRVQERLLLSCGCAAGAEGRIEAACVALDLQHVRQRRLFALSAGELQRVELASLLVRDARIWLLDEPTAHLDLRHQVAWLSQLREQVEGTGRAIGCVLHDLHQAASVADEAILMRPDGRLVQGSAAELLQVETLSALYETPLLRLGEGEGATIVPRFTS